MSAANCFADIGFFADTDGNLTVSHVAFERPLHGNAAAHGDRTNHSLILTAERGNSPRYVLKLFPNSQQKVKKDAMVKREILR